MLKVVALPSEGSNPEMQSSSSRPPKEVVRRVPQLRTINTGTYVFRTTQLTGHPFEDQHVETGPAPQLRNILESQPAAQVLAEAVSCPGCCMCTEGVNVNMATVAGQGQVTVTPMTWAQMATFLVLVKQALQPNETIWLIVKGPGGNHVFRVGR